MVDPQGRLTLLGQRGNHRAAQSRRQLARLCRGGARCHRLAAATEALDQSRAALAQLQKMEAIGQLTGGVAHDFNNLLQSILGSVELLQRPDGLADRARTERLLDTARRAAERGATLTQRLLA